MNERISPPADLAPAINSDAKAPLRLKIPGEVMSREVGHEVVILDLARGTYYGLNNVGARVWQLIGAGTNPVDIGAVVAAEYAVTPEVARHDIEALVDDLLTKGLLIRDPAEAA